MQQFESEPRKLFKMAASMRIQYYQENEAIVNVHEIGEEFYIIHSGHVQVLIEQKNEFTVDKISMIPVAELHTGSSFGELALQNDQPRAATIIALQPTFVIVLTKKMFKKAIDDLAGGKYKPIVEFLKQTAIF